MAATYGTVKSYRGKASLMSNRSTGIHTTAQSYDGSVNVWLRYFKGELLVGIDIADGSSTDGKNVFTGTIDELRAKLTA